VLEGLSSEVKVAVLAIMKDSKTRMDALYARTEKEGRDPTATEIAAIENQTRAELQKILTVTQLEEFLLRNSRSALELRTELASLRYFNTTAAEYRSLFRIGEQFDQQIALLADKTDANSVRLRKSLEDQRERAIKQALGAGRYDLFTKLHDTDYQTAFAQARDAGEPGSVGTIFELNRATQEELNQLRASSNMTDAQFAIAAKRIELEQLKATAEAYGQSVPADPNAPPAPPPPPQPRSHVIRSGETFGGLATSYGVPVSAILDANPGIQLNNLRAGQRIVIPPLETHRQ
jgi:LysM repeat protein